MTPGSRSRCADLLRYVPLCGDSLATGVEPEPRVELGSSGYEAAALPLSYTGIAGDRRIELRSGWFGATSGPSPSPLVGREGLAPPPQAYETCVLLLNYLPWGGRPGSNSRQNHLAAQRCAQRREPQIGATQQPQLMTGLHWARKRPMANSHRISDPFVWPTRIELAPPASQTGALPLELQPPWTREESNFLPPVYQTGALTIELHVHRALRRTRTLALGP